MAQASIVNIIANTFLFTIKVIVGFMFGALSILSDAINSLGDIIAAVITFVSIKINSKDADECHEFGHTRAENIAGYTTGILMFVLAAYIIKAAIENLISREIPKFGNLMLWVILVTFLVKLSMYFYIKATLKNKNSPSLKANMQDHLNDIIIILGVFVAVIGIKYNIWWADSIMSLAIAIYILKMGLNITIENIHFLMGKTADPKIVEKIKKTALKTKGVIDVEKVLTQYLGNKIQAEIHIEVDKKLSVKQAHDIGTDARANIEKLKEINNCFVHVDVFKE